MSTDPHQTWQRQARILRQAWATYFGEAAMGQFQNSSMSVWGLFS